MHVLDISRMVAGIACAFLFRELRQGVASWGALQSYTESGRFWISVVVSLIAIGILAYVLYAVIRMLPRFVKRLRNHHELERFRDYWIGHSVGDLRPHTFAEIYYDPKANRYGYRGRSYHDDFLTGQPRGAPAISNLKKESKYAEWGDNKTFVFSTDTTNRAIFYSGASVYEDPARPGPLDNIGTIELKADGSELVVNGMDMSNIGDGSGSFLSRLTRYSKKKLEESLDGPFEFSDENILKLLDHYNNTANR